jgi:transcriptional regulator with XRE-family HTH domain
MFDKEKLKRLRLAKGWTLKTLAERSGVSYVVVRRLESGGRTGTRQPRPDTLAKLARALNVPVDALLISAEPEQMSREDQFKILRMGERLHVLGSDSPEGTLQPPWLIGQTDPEQFLAAIKRTTGRTMKLWPLFLTLSEKDQETVIAFAHFLQGRAKEQAQKEEEQP